MINLSRNKNICCGLKKVVAKSRARVYFKQQILALLLVFHQIHNLSRNKCRNLGSTPSKSTNQRAAFLQLFLLCDKLITQGEKRETSTQNLQGSNVARQVQGFCISYFAAFIRLRLAANLLNIVSPQFCNESGMSFCQFVKMIHFKASSISKALYLLLGNNGLIFLTKYNSYHYVLTEMFLSCL